MKIKQLYIKILLSFLGVLIITLALSIILFIFTAGRAYKADLNQQTLSKLQIFREIIQDDINLHPDLPIDKNPDLLKQLNMFSDLFDVKIWISDLEDTILLKTFKGPANVPQTGVQRQVHHDNGITLYHFVLKWIKYYATIPISAGEDHFRLHLFYDTGNPDHPEGLFLMGILIIGGVVALMVIPLASVITRRVNRLNRSAMELARGNLSSRADIQGHDEIAKLGNSFNLMADKLEKLIQNAKELTANVSHELRSPLARLRVSKELILDKLDQKDTRADIRRYIDHMESDIQSLDTLVEHMLTLSKMDYQESSLTLEKFSFSSFLREEVATYQALLHQKDLTMALDIDGPVHVSQDKSVLKSILSNLLDNAIKYTDNGKTIYIHAQKDSAQGLTFTVSNPCLPLTDDELALLFKPFYRRPGHSAPGSGLGLTITQKQVIRCKGKISARNTDEGLTFGVNLP